MADTPAQTQPSSALTVAELMQDYRDIHLMLNAQWPLDTQNERLAGRMLKLTEELGELTNEVLTKMGLQRQAKIDAFEDIHLEDELADVLGSVFLLAVELDLDVEAILRRKIAFTIDRLQAELEQGV